MKKSIDDLVTEAYNIISKKESCGKTVYIEDLPPARSFFKESVGDMIFHTSSKSYTVIETKNRPGSWLSYDSKHDIKYDFLWVIITKQRIYIPEDDKVVEKTHCELVPSMDSQYYDDMNPEWIKFNFSLIETEEEVSHFTDTDDIDDTGISGLSIDPASSVGSPSVSIGAGGPISTGTTTSGVWYSPLDIDDGHTHASMSGIAPTLGTTISVSPPSPSLTVTEAPIYAESFLPHLEHAKEEGSRMNIEMDTIVIDRGVAVSQGLEHADIILGLKVKYAKEGALPMGSAFMILKDSKKAKDIKAREEAERELEEENKGINLALRNKELQKENDAFLELIEVLLKGEEAPKELLEKVESMKSKAAWRKTLRERISTISGSYGSDDKGTVGVKRETVVLDSGSDSDDDCEDDSEVKVKFRDGADEPFVYLSADKDKVIKKNILNFSVSTKPVGRSVPKGGVPAMPKGFDFATLELLEDDTDFFDKTATRKSTYKIYDINEARKVAHLFGTTI